MAIIVKIGAKGIDAKIDQLQRYLFNNLGWTNYQSCHRAYRNPKEDSIIPEVYIGNNEYREVFFDDNFDATSYFLVDDENPIEDRGLQPTISMYFQVKIDKIEPGITHRADEEIMNRVLFWISKNSFGIKATSRVTGIPSVYAGLKQDQIPFDDMSNFLAFRIVLDFPIILPDFCPTIVVPVCPQDTFLKALFGSGNDVMETLTIDADNAGTYTSITDDGTSGTITLDHDGGGDLPFSSPLILLSGETLIIKRSISVAAGFVKLTGTFV